MISWVFSRRPHFLHSLFLSITLSSPNLQTRGIVPSLLLSGQPFQSINWTRVRGKFLLPKQHLSEHMSPPEWMYRPLSSLSLLARLLLFIPWCRRGRRSATANSLSDERDKWQRCFGSGDSALAEQCVHVRECVCGCVLGRWREGGAGERERERLKVTDVSSLAMRNMISSPPVIQTYRPWHSSREQLDPRCCLYKQSPVCLPKNWE